MGGAEASLSTRNNLIQLAGPLGQGILAEGTPRSPEYFKGKVRKLDTVCQSENWKRYAQYFDTDMRQRISGVLDHKDGVFP